MFRKGTFFFTGFSFNAPFFFTEFRCVEPEALFQRIQWRANQRSNKANRTPRTKSDSCGFVFFYFSFFFWCCPFFYSFFFLPSFRSFSKRNKTSVKRLWWRRYLVLKKNEMEIDSFRPHVDRFYRVSCKILSTNNTKPCVQIWRTRDRLYWVVPSFYWVSTWFEKRRTSFTGFYLVLLGFTKFYWVLLSFYWVLPGFT